MLTIYGFTALLRQESWLFLALNAEFKKYLEVQFKPNRNYTFQNTMNLTRINGINEKKKLGDHKIEIFW